MEWPVMDGAEARPLSSFPTACGILGNIKHPSEAPNRRKTYQLTECLYLFHPINYVALQRVTGKPRTKETKSWCLSSPTGRCCCSVSVCVGGWTERQGDGERGLRPTWTPSVQTPGGQNSSSLRPQSTVIRCPLLLFSWLLQARAQPACSAHHGFCHVGQEQESSRKCLGVTVRRASWLPGTTVLLYGTGYSDSGERF